MTEAVQPPVVMPRVAIQQTITTADHPRSVSSPRQAQRSSENYIISNDDTGSWAAMEVAQLRSELEEERGVRQQQDERIAKALGKIEACAADLTRIREYHEGVTQRSEELEAAIQQHGDLANRVAKTERQLSEGISVAMAGVDALVENHAKKVDAQLAELEQRVANRAEMSASQYAQRVSEQLTKERTIAIEVLSKTQEERFSVVEGERR